MTPKKKKTENNILAHILNTVIDIGWIRKLANDLGKTKVVIGENYKKLENLDQYVECNRKDLRLSYRPGKGGLLLPYPYYYINSDGETIGVNAKDLRKEYYKNFRFGI